MATEIRQISFSNLRRHGRHELKFVYEEMGHLWLTFHGKPRAVIIPMRDETILHRAIGLDPREALHRAQIDHSRHVAAIEERKRWLSDPMMTVERLYPRVGTSDAEHKKVLTYDPHSHTPRRLSAQEIAEMSGET
ncbi:hypothetical protein KUV51_20150 [Tateyamaria omphalii]|uniref:hypothetical protein n=1 Tax=Tateyamaria omphalii TaxID=299262 RepID=UPI001C99D9D5|nr:hypothetical protein [Tateyamaria omphalii]MBY5935330.1 hypothetical protein [Tateyamaria omphalii]